MPTTETPAQSPLSADLEAILRCLNCGGKLESDQARMLDTFDWYSPKYQPKHTYEQVFKWYAAMGMEDMSVGEISIAVCGRKPAKAH
jgi:hypothetical protein